MQPEPGEKIHVMHLPKWYPNKLDPQLGVFVLKHIKAISRYCNPSVLFPVSTPGLKEKYQIKISEKDGIFSVIVYFKKSETSFFGFGKIITFIRYLIAYKKGAKLIRKKMGKPSLVHAHILLRTGVWALLYNALKNIPYVISEHWSGYINKDYKKKSGLYKFILSKVIKHASSVMVVSEKLKKAIDSSGLSNRNISVVPNIIDVPDERDVIVKKDKHKIVILSVADLVDDIKNISSVIRVIADLTKEIESIEYNIIGDGQDRVMLEKLVDEFDLPQDTIIFHGRQNNDFVYDFMRVIDFLITNSNTETFSVVTAEALINAKPVIATKCGGPEIFVNEKNGILIDPGNNNQLREAIIQMIKRYKTYDKEYMVNSVKYKYSSEVVGKRINEVYRNVIAGRK